MVFADTPFQILKKPFIIFDVHGLSYIPYTAKLLSGKTFAVVHKIHYSLENFHGASGRSHHVLYTKDDSRGKLLRLAEKTAKVFPLESFAVYGKLSKYANYVAN